MATITLKGNEIHTVGELPAKGAQAPPIRLVGDDLAEVTFDACAGKKKVLNIFPSVDTGVCAASVRRFNEEASRHPETVVINISADLPFALKRFCGSEGLNDVVNLSCFRATFADDYGVKIADGPLQGLCSRAVIVLDKDNTVLYTEQVPEIAQAPDYDKALAALA